MDLTQRIKPIRCLALDVDGVMTDGRIVVGTDGTEFKFFDVRDGHGLKMVKRAGLLLAFITARPSPITSRRAEELGIDEVFQGSLSKAPSFEELLRKRDLREEEVCYVGDDVVDLPVMARAGLACAPADAVGEVLQAAHYVSRFSGGRGAVRDISEMILKAQGHWDVLMERYGWAPAEEKK